MEQSPSIELNSSWADGEITRLAWVLEVYYRVHKTPPLIPTMSQMNPIHIFPHYIPKIHLTVSYHPRLDLLNILFPSVFPTKILYVFFISPMRATCHAYLILIHLIILLKI
jgi:hypothetical protein